MFINVKADSDENERKGEGGNGVTCNIGKEMLGSNSHVHSVLVLEYNTVPYTLP